MPRKRRGGWWKWVSRTSAETVSGKIFHLTCKKAKIAISAGNEALIVIAGPPGSGESAILPGNSSGTMLRFGDRILNSRIPSAGAPFHRVSRPGIRELSILSTNLSRHPDELQPPLAIALAVSQCTIA